MAQPQSGVPVWGDPVRVTNENGLGPAIVVCEHASNFIPPHLNDLGLEADVRESHVAWDPGALAVASTIATTLDCPLVAASISRLVYDCNRPPSAESAMPAVSEIFPIPSNQDLSDAARSERVDRIYNPFHAAVSAVIERRLEAGTEPAIVTIHSFTPTYHGVRRPFEIGILHDEDSRLADAMLDRAEVFNGLDVRRNEPYGPVDGVTHTLRRHALPRGLLNVMIEIRNDVIRQPSEQTAMAQVFSDVIGDAISRCTGSDRPSAGNSVLHKA
ncbi:N-formylglutamate amidohydrolase [Nisaea sp.]|uniref:N-formylglutamate amidohydrolase n=1 Tax=Nisaea sp. TaxID=2024842 RepID=UPI002B267DDD|nr:N-formylglutamate amidohydrolase [Nisaea sp.]